jgi:two-component system alkaline phosphatase synthesis response regulator PhoP
MDTPNSHREQPVNVGQKKVLVIDDTNAIVEYIKQVLLSLGYTDIITAGDGIEGLEKFYRERPDCVIVDVKMPGLDGYQVVRAIRGDRSMANTPLIILSALQQPDQQLTGLLSGVDEYMPKPFKRSMLAAALDRVMSITPAEREQRMESLANGELPAGGLPGGNLPNG